MGFSSALQGRAAHEALIVRQDAELRLMETMKRSIQMKAKCDREYAISLAAVTQQGLKIDRADELQGSLITKSWRSYMDELDQQAKQLRTNADLLEIVCEKFLHLSQDKRKARKLYQEEHSKIAARLNHLTDEVIRKKTEYQKHLEGYKALRTRFEEHYIKSGRSGRKLDDVRDKYQKACRKLHLTHNEYVLSITEAIEVEKDFRTVLLPGLLEHQQSVQESFILLWKNTLQEVSQHSDLTCNKFQEIQRRIDSAINNINPNEEYREFTEKHKTSPASPIVFQFDESLIEDIPGKLQSNTLTVDNLTVDWLRAKLGDLEASVKDYQERQVKIIGDLNDGSPRANGAANGAPKDSQKQSKDLNSIRCQEKQKQKLVDMIKIALSEVGCEELPSGCDDHLNVDQNFIESNFNRSNDQQPTSNVSVNSMSSILNKKSMAEVIQILRAPFKRKSVPPQPTTPTARPRSHVKQLQPRSQSLGSLAVNTQCSQSQHFHNGKLKTSTSVEAANDRTNDNIRVVFEPYDFPKNNKSVLCVIEEPSTNIYAELDLANTDMAEESISNFVTDVQINEPSLSIDAHLDKIDIINKTLDNNLKKSTFLHTSEDLDAIESDPLESTMEFLENKEAAAIPPDVISKRSLSSIESRSKIKVASTKKRSTSFSHKSINALITNIKEFKFKGSPLYRPNKPTSHSITNDILGDVSCSEIPKKVPIGCGKPRSNKSKAIRTTFRNKFKSLNFQLTRAKMCDECSKKRRIHPSKSVFDFAKEFHLTDVIDLEFCDCPEILDECDKVPHLTKGGVNTNFECVITNNSDEDDDDVQFKDHNYCEPFMTYSTSRPLYEEEWFHGVLPREEVVRLLKVDGDFLVRETTRNEESQIVLSVCWNGHKHFIVQTAVDGHFRFEGPPFPSIQELIMHQYQSELPVTVKSGAILRKPISRELWELSNDDVVLLEKIGRGNFGDVYKAKLKSTKLDVAVKTCRMTLPDEQKRKFLQEGRILKQYDHPNIVKLIGICVQKQPIMIVMELVPGGSLLNFLRKNSNSLTCRQLMGMCRDAAAGMRYLESKNCIHRDLAARNCLIDYENSVKISDFGMSREEEEYIVSDGMKQIPVKWTAPEALNFGKYTSLCDVWSYGILMWEIFSKGDTPYSGMSNSRARERIDTGYRMSAPENTPPEMYRLMIKCWAAEAEARPHFDEIYTVVSALINRHDSE